MRIVSAWVAVSFLLAASGNGQEPSVSLDFSEARLREGKDAYRSRRPLDAVSQLRIAAFGLLDRPHLLCESLVYLALAQETSDHHAEAQASLRRLLEIESRIPECADAKLDPAIRAEFVSRFRQRLPEPAAPAPTLRPQNRAPTPRPGNPNR